MSLWINEYIVYSRIIPDSFFEEEELQDTTPAYISQPSLPLSFCETHWYSAWSVMERFYSIRNSLTASQNHLTRCQHFSFTDEDANELLNLLHFLKPLVDGINYCQKPVISPNTRNLGVFRPEDLPNYSNFLFLCLFVLSFLYARCHEIAKSSR